MLHFLLLFTLMAFHFYHKMLSWGMSNFTYQDNYMEIMGNPS